MPRPTHAIPPGRDAGGTGGTGSTGRARSAVAVRGWCGALAVLVLAAGLALQFVARSPLVDLAGSALYTALIGLLLALVAPRWPAWRPAVLAFAVSAAIELMQLTGLPAVLVERAPPLRLVFGSSFDPLDLVGYAAGGLLVWGVRRAIGEVRASTPR